MKHFIDLSNYDIVPQKYIETLYICFKILLNEISMELFLLGYY